MASSWRAFVPQIYLPSPDALREWRLRIPPRKNQKKWPPVSPPGAIDLAAFYSPTPGRADLGLDAVSPMRAADFPAVAGRSS